MGAGLVCGRIGRVGLDRIFGYLPKAALAGGAWKLPMG